MTSGLRLDCEFPSVPPDAEVERVSKQFAIALHWIITVNIDFELETLVA